MAQFHLHIALILSKHNQIADTLSQIPRVNAISIAYNNDLTSMLDEYAIDPNFTNVMSTNTMGKTQDPYKISDGYLLYGNCLYNTKNLREKVMI